MAQTWNLCIKKITHRLWGCEVVWVLFTIQICNTLVAHAYDCIYIYICIYTDTQTQICTHGCNIFWCQQHKTKAIIGCLLPIYVISDLNNNTEDCLHYSSLFPLIIHKFLLSFEMAAHHVILLLWVAFMFKKFSQVVIYHHLFSFSSSHGKGQI